MRINYQLFVAFFLAIFVVGCGDQERRQMPIAKDCGIGQKPVCRVSFRALASTPRLFDGKSIRVEGYLGVSRGLFVLNSSKELFEAGVTDETQVRIKGPIDLQRDLFNRYAYSWVSVTGEFRLRKTDGSTDDLLLGEMHAPLDVQSLRVPGPIPRATFGDVSVDLEDLK